MSDRFKVTLLGRLLFARALPGLAAIGFAAASRPVMAGIFLLVASLGDLLVDSWAVRTESVKAKSDVQLEGFVDFACFVWAPVQFTLALGGPSALALIASLVFVFSGAFRLARFNVEGMSNGGYRGLPVTYSGVLVPFAALAAGLSGTVPPSAAASLAGTGATRSRRGSRPDSAGIWKRMLCSESSRWRNARRPEPASGTP